MNRHRTRSALLLLSLIFVTVLAVEFPFDKLVRANPPEPTLTRTMQPSRYAGTLRSLQEALANSTADPEHREALEARIQYLTYRATWEADTDSIATGNVLWATKIAQETRTPWPTVQGRRILGIIEDPSAPIVREKVLVTNLWNGEANGEVIQVFAGALRTDPAQGVLFVKTYELDAITVLTETYFLAPYPTGKLRIVAFQNARLTLNTEAGENLYFDGSTREFSASLENWVPMPAPTLETPEPGLSIQSQPLSESTPAPYPDP